MDEDIPSDDSCWSHTPEDLLIRIFSGLEMLDLLTSGAVCRSWHSHYLSVRRLGLCSADNQGPCLVYASRSGDGDRDQSVATMHRLSTNKVYQIPLQDPPFRARYIFGSSHGWLVAADEKSNPLLFNPITGAHIDLPPVKTLAPVRLWFTKERVFYGHAIFNISPASPEIQTGRKPLIFTEEETRHALYMKAALSSDPMGGNNCTVLLIHKPNCQLSFARPGDSKWTWIVANGRAMLYDDCFYDEKDGVFYAIMCGGEVHAIDLNGPAPSISIIMKAVQVWDGCSKYIVRAPWGDLLQVWRYHNLHNGERRTIKIKVYRVDLRDGHSQDVCSGLVEINDLKGDALFVGLGTSFFVNVKGFPMLTPNCIYFSHDKAKFEQTGISLQELLVFNLTDGTFTDFVPPASRCLSFPPPIWMRPTCS